MDQWQAVPTRNITLLPGYWLDRLRVNARAALYHQYNQLVETGCIRNFELVSGGKGGFREGFFFADSDAYKWLEAALLSLAAFEDLQLQTLVDQFITILGRAQGADGYLYTYNQIHFPNSRWQNLQVEHELYCLGHLIEAGVTAIQLGVQPGLQQIAVRAADLVVKEFSQGGPERTDGHEEIEIALLRLYRVTGEQKYLTTARHLLEVRGRARNYAWLAISQLSRTVMRMRARDRMRRKYYREHPDEQVIHLPARNAYHVPGNMGARLVHSMATGKYTQSHRPLREQDQAVGHAVRFVYLQTARAMLADCLGDRDDVDRMRVLWQGMVSRRMYVTGGLGALPLVEGFGRDYELPAEGAYAETCAALGSIFWNQEMGLLTGEACFDDLLEWQMYNAASVGAGIDGCTYLYNNPMETSGEVQRVEWYDCPCCPSNLSRTWSHVAGYAFSTRPGVVRVRQFISAECLLDLPGNVRLEMVSGLPWRGKVRMVIHCEKAAGFRLEIRRPSWAGECRLSLNGAALDGEPNPVEPIGETAACGYDLRRAGWLAVERVWQDGDILEVDLDARVRIYPQDNRIGGYGGKSAVGYGPLIYCRESLSNEGQPFVKRIDPASLTMDFREELLGGTTVLNGVAVDNQPVELIPYFLWGNRGPSTTKMFFDV